MNQVERMDIAEKSQFAIRSFSSYGFGYWR